MRTPPVLARTGRWLAGATAGAMMALNIAAQTPQQFTVCATDQRAPIENLEVRVSEGNNLPTTGTTGTNGCTSLTVNTPIENQELPSKFTISQPYPNPAGKASTVHIPFTIDQTQPVSIAIYNLLGQQIANQAFTHLPLGNHAITLDADALPTGLYVAQIQAGDEVYIAKFIDTGAQTTNNLDVRIHTQTQAKQLVRFGKTAEFYTLDVLLTDPGKTYRDIQTTAQIAANDTVFIDLGLLAITLKMWEMSDHYKAHNGELQVNQNGHTQIINPQAGSYTFRPITERFGILYQDAQHTNSRQVFREGEGQVYGSRIGRAFKPTGFIRADIKDFIGQEQLNVNGFAMKDSFNEQLYFEIISNSSDMSNPIVQDRVHHAPCFDTMTPEWTWYFDDDTLEPVEENTKEKVRYTYARWDDELFSQQWRDLSFRETTFQENPLTLQILGITTRSPPGSHLEVITQQGCIETPKYYSPIAEKGLITERDAMTELYQNLSHNDPKTQGFVIVASDGMHFTQEAIGVISVQTAYGPDPDLFKTLRE